MKARTRICRKRKPQRWVRRKHKPIMSSRVPEKWKIDRWADWLWDSEDARQRNFGPCSRILGPHTAMCLRERANWSPFSNLYSSRAGLTWSITQRRDWENYRQAHLHLFLFDNASRKSCKNHSKKLCHSPIAALIQHRAGKGMGAEQNSTKNEKQINVIIPIQALSQDTSKSISLPRRTVSANTISAPNKIERLKCNGPDSGRSKNTIRSRCRHGL